MLNIVLKWSVSGIVVSMLFACGGGGGGGASSGGNVAPSSSATDTSTATSVQSPTTLGISTTRGRIVVPVQALGTTTLSKPIAVDFDTGSSGVLINALDVFPSSVVTAAGFVFPVGQTTLQYNGIVVTNLQATKSFGSATARTVFTGDIGFAQIKLGEHGELTTQSMPILFYFSVTDQNGSTKSAGTHGILGTNSGANAVIVNGSAAPTTLSVCSLQSSGSCDLLSPFRYVNYGPGISAGFMLGSVTLNPSCDEDTWAGCTSAQLLTVGLTSSLESGFSVNALACPGNQPSGTSPSGMSACQPEILGTVAVAGTGQSFSEFALFDSGTFGEVVYVPDTDSTGFPSPVAPGTGVSVTLLSGFVYSYSVGAINTATSTQFNLNVTTPQRNVFGVHFFTAHPFFIDYARQIEGFK